MINIITNNEVGKKQTSKIEIIQVMRAVAAIGIVYFHTEYGLYKSADWGVDFFFILSGFFCMLSTEDKRDGRRYWKTKLIRFCPLYYTMTIGVILLYFVKPTILKTTIVTWETFIKSILFIPCYAKRGEIFPIYNVGWTMNLEMFFYVIFFLAMKLAYRYRGIIVSIFLCILIGVGFVLQPQSAIGESWTNIRLINFVAGILIYYLYTVYSQIKINKGISAVAIICSIFFLFSGRYILQDNFTILWNTLGGYFIICMFIWMERRKVSGNFSENRRYEFFNIYDTLFCYKISE